MKQIDYKTLMENIDLYENEIYRIFSKLLEEDMKAKTKILAYGSYSTFEEVDWSAIDETNVTVRYYDNGYDLYDSSGIIIVQYFYRKILKFLKKYFHKYYI